MVLKYRERYVYFPRRSVELYKIPNERFGINTVTEAIIYY